VLIKPDEISVTESMYEDEDDFAPSTKIVNKKTGRKGGGRWERIEANTTDCFADLP
jgi:hypothetical protein